MVENTFNLEDRPALAAVFFVFLVAAHVFVAARLLAFRVLKRQLGLVSIRLKSVVAAVPVTFATILAVRTANHKLNNACAELVPYSYLVRFFIQIALLCFQLRAFIVLRWFTTFGLPQHARKRQRFLAAAFLCMFVPACVLCGLMWGLGLGIQLNGVCTIGKEDGSDSWLGIRYQRAASTPRCGGGATNVSLTRRCVQCVGVG